MSPEDDNSSVDRFLLDEINDRRSEIARMIEQIESQQKWGLFACAGFWAWVFADQSNEVIPGLLFIPATASALLFLRFCAYDRAVRFIAEYITKVEQYFLEAHRDLGWERTFLPSKNLKHLVALNKAYWTLVMVGNLMIAIWFLNRS